MEIYLGSDHAGLNLKKVLKDYLTEKFQGQEDFKVLDLGVFTNDATDYPDISREVCEKVVENQDSFGVLICGTGVGMSISANRHKGIRAVLANNEETARLARSHNNANVLCLGSSFTADEMAKAILGTFVDTEFDSEERHVRRIGKIEKQSKDSRGTPDEGRC